MKFIIKCILGFSIILIILLSCNNHKCPCGRARLPVKLVSFTTDEEDTVILKRFIKGTNFQSLHDSLLIDSANCFYDKQDPNSVVLSVLDSAASIDTDFDYEIYIPSVNRHTKVSSIIESYTGGLCARCVNPVKSYIMDGKTVSTVPLTIEK